MTIGSVNGRAIIGSDLLVKNVSYKDTPVTITSWSYLTTTITLNVASHTFVAGDYIEVGGLTATTNIPNGVHLVTSVTVTTIVFTYALTPTGTAGVSSAIVKGYMTTNGRAESIGAGQIWQGLTASRVLGTIYTNTTGKTIEVMVGCVSAGGAFTPSAVVGDTILSLFGAATNIGAYAQTTFLVPSGMKYSVVSNGSILHTWVELR